VGVRKAAVAGVNRHLGGRQGEDQPSVTNIDGTKLEHISNKCAVGFGIRTVEQQVGSRDHKTKSINVTMPDSLCIVKYLAGCP
jgi:hypothetical protein